MARRARTCPFDGPVVLRFAWVEPTRRRDLDNVAAAKKLVIDGLVLAGVLPGDGWRWVRGFADAFTVGEPAGVTVTIETAS